VNYVDLWGLDSVYFYEKGQGIHTNGNSFIDEITTYYSDEKQELEKHREEQVGAMAIETYPAPWSKIQSETFDIYVRPLANDTLEVRIFSEIKEAPKPDNLNLPDGSVVPLNGSAADNGLKCEG
jgi:hypothetical protein